MKYRPFVSATEAFTVIEVLIVLAITGLVFAIIFLAVPAVQGNSRDYGRKNFIQILNTQMQEYKNNNAHYPETYDDACDFLLHYADTQGNKIIGGCDPSWSGYGECVTVTTRLYTICYHNNNVPHDYTGKLDEISIALSHWCNTDPAKFDEDPSHPITNGNEWPFDELLSRYVIWTPLERNKTGYCIDDYPRDI